MTKGSAVHGLGGNGQGCNLDTVTSFPNGFVCPVRGQAERIPDDHSVRCIRTADGLTKFIPVLSAATRGYVAITTPSSPPLAK